MVRRNTKLVKQDSKRLNKLYRHRSTISSDARVNRLVQSKKAKTLVKTISDKAVSGKKPVHMDKAFIKSLIQEERLGEAGKLLVSFGHKDLGITISKFSEVLPYVSPKQYTKVVHVLNAAVDKEYAVSISKAKENTEGIKNKEDLTSFNRLKDAMVHYTDAKNEEEERKQEEQSKRREERKQKDIDDMAGLFKSSKFKPLPATISISAIQGDIVIIGKINNIEKAIGDDYDIRRLSYTEAIIKDVSLLGVREDRLLIPAFITKHKKGVKRKKYLVDREKKARKKLITLETLSRMVERKFPKQAIPGQHVYAKPHCYYPLLPYTVFCPPCSALVMGKIMPALQKWYILGLA